jgi:molybdopterin-guanine dinucleotide biosynthesis protein A
MTQPVWEPDRIDDCTGVIVAGGAGKRLGGIPKGLLLVDGEPIVARTLRLFARIFPASLVVANDPAPYWAFGVPVIGDVLPGKGAPGGLHAALTAATTSWVFAVACDMPFLSLAPIAWLAARRSAAPVAAVVWRGRLEPLHAFWSRACLPVCDRALRAGDPSLQAVAREVGAQLVTEEEWRSIDPCGRAFANVNTPADADALFVKCPPR